MQVVPLVAHRFWPHTFASMQADAQHTEPIGSPVLTQNVLVHSPAEEQPVPKAFCGLHRPEPLQ